MQKSSQFQSTVEIQSTIPPENLITSNIFTRADCTRNFLKTKRGALALMTDLDTYFSGLGEKTLSGVADIINSNAWQQFSEAESCISAG